MDKEISCHYLSYYFVACLNLILHVQQLTFSLQSLFLVMLSHNCTEFNSSSTQACAECFMSVSTASPAMMRKNELSQCFVSLLCDKSRWVCTQKFHFCVFCYSGYWCSILLCYYKRHVGGCYLYFVVNHELHPIWRLIGLPKQFCTLLYSWESWVERVTMRVKYLS